ncbi:hypothetical protein DIE23_37555 [Burkholderia sp. Bp9143]|nr:hypothetical protein DIE23_37555 [Burkholderia sp. Bp9143]
MLVIARGPLSGADSRYPQKAGPTRLRGLAFPVRAIIVRFLKPPLNKEQPCKATRKSSNT